MENRKENNTKLIEFWEGEIKIKKSNCQYHNESWIKAEKRIQSLKNQIKDLERKAEYHKGQFNSEKGNIAICEGRIEMLKSDNKVTQ